MWVIKNSCIYLINVNKVVGTNSIMWSMKAGKVNNGTER